MRGYYRSPERDCPSPTTPPSVSSLRLFTFPCLYVSGQAKSAFRRSTSQSAEQSSHHRTTPITTVRLVLCTFFNYADRFQHFKGMVQPSFDLAGAVYLPSMSLVILFDGSATVPQPSLIPSDLSCMETWSGIINRYITSAIQDDRLLEREDTISHEKQPDITGEILTFGLGGRNKAPQGKSQELVSRVAAHYYHPTDHTLM